MSVLVASGVRLGVDVGSVRIGVAASDPQGVLATPVAVVARSRRTGADLDTIAELVVEQGAVEVVVGLPRSLSGKEGAAAASARDYADALAKRIAPVPVRLVDERLSTVQATRGMQQAGVSSRRARHTVDAAAAVVILQSALDTERAGRTAAEEPSS